MITCNLTVWGILGDNNSINVWYIIYYEYRTLSVIMCMLYKVIYEHNHVHIVYTGFGLASQLGVLAGIPCVGVGKNLYHVDGLTKGPLHKEKVYTVLASSPGLLRDFQCF